MTHRELTEDDIQWLAECHIENPCDDIDEETEVAFNEIIIKAQREQLRIAADKIATLTEERNNPHPDIDTEATIAALNGQVMEAQKTINVLGGAVMALGTVAAVLVVVCSLLWGR